jgi:opacity protein-like surface antigen
MLDIKKFFAVFLLSVSIPVSLVFAQDSDDFNPLQKGSKALQFQITSNFTLNSFAGSAISYKHQVSHDRARRIGISLENSYFERETPESEMEFNENRLDLSFGAEYTWMKYTNPESDAKFYYGYGPRVNARYDITEVLTGNRIAERSRNTLGLAAIGYAGVEWFFKSNMSLHAEYRISAQVNYFNEKIVVEENGTETDRIENKVRIINLNGEGVRFGLSVYF